MATPPFLPDESKPGASDLISLFPNAEQTFRDIIEDWILIEHNTNGTHTQVTLDDIATPTIAADLVGLWHESGVLKTRFATGDVADVLTSATGMPLAGGTMTGDLVLAGVPDADLKAATKKYVDDADALKANIASPALTGNPTAPTQTAGNDSTRLASTAFVATAVAGSGFAGALLHVRDQKSTGTDGGTFTTGAWQTRTLNTAVTNEITGASLSANRFTLPTGTYFIIARAPAMGDLNEHKSKLRNISDSSDTLLGSSERAGSTAVQTNSWVIGRFTIASAKIFELQHRCAVTKATDGFGAASGFSVTEVYADVQVWKL